MRPKPPPGVLANDVDPDGQSPSAVLVSGPASGTLAFHADGSFEYVKGRLGIRNADALRVPSDFDYTTQALLYLPKRMPSPKAPAFAESAAREITRILTCSRGRAFVLFTSYAVLRSVQRIVEMSLPYPVLVQGTAPRTELIERFRLLLARGAEERDTALAAMDAAFRWDPQPWCPEIF